MWSTTRVNIRTVTISYIYINDLGAVSQITFPIMYADDTNIFIQGKDFKKMEKDLNTEIKKLSLWLKINKLSLNI